MFLLEDVKLIKKKNSTFIANLIKISYLFYRFRIYSLKRIYTVIKQNKLQNKFFNVKTRKNFPPYSNLFFKDTTDFIIY